jgi:SAM-dependent methyltransferase
MREITVCEVCSNTELVPVMNLGEHPLPDDMRPIGTEPLSPTYPVEVLWCDKCNTAHQRFQVSKHKLFPPTYHYRARQTKDVLDGMQRLVASVLKRRSLNGLKVLDVGCNDGSLLTCFREAGEAVHTYGIEPTDAALDARAAGHNVEQAFLDPYEADRFTVRHGKPDIVTFTNVFAHIEHLDALLVSLRRLIHPGTLLVIENHYLGSIIDRDQFDTFYHEHPRTYSRTSFEFIAERLGMHIDDVEYPQRYGGNIRVFMRCGAAPMKITPERLFGPGLIELGNKIANWRRHKRVELLTEFRAYGPLAAVAFPGRAAILMRMIGLPDEIWKGVYEKPGSRKIGFYVPGTHVPIVSDEMYPADMAARDAPIINMAWHIPAEIATRWRGKGFRGRIVPIISPEDFRP